MKYIKPLFLLFLLVHLASCSEEDFLIRDLVFNQNNTGTSSNLPTRPVLSFDPSSVNFGTVENGTKTTKTISISNSHSAPVDITVTHINSVSSISYSESNFVIPANGTFQFTVSFEPTATIFLNDTLHFSYAANQSNSTGPIIQNVNLSGNSVEMQTPTANLTYTPSGTLDFGTVINGPTVTKNITLNNIGTATANWTPVGNILVFDPTSGSIAPGNSQTIALIFTATGVGVYNNTQIFSYNGGTVQVPYTVNRVAATKIMDVSCTTTTAFGNVAVNTTVSKTIKISNTGNSDLTVSQITLSQVPSGQFACSYSGVIPPNSSVTVPITFKPTSTGSKTCTIIVQSDKTSGNNRLSFNGYGI